MALVMMIGAPGVYAQGGTSTAVKSPPESGSGPWPAPVGHRQPRASDVPDEKNLTNNGPMDLLTKENQALDKKIKSICRGC